MKKEKYERPVFLMEEYVLNQVVSTCDTNQECNLKTTKCFIGGRVETENVLLEGSSCSAQVKFFEGATTAYHPNRRDGSMVSGNTYTAPKNAIGLIVWCASDGGNTKNASAWSSNGSQATHANINSLNNDSIHKGRGYHCHVAPVYNVSVGLS